jgi:hypothetical protein
MNVHLMLWRAHPEPNVCGGVVCECERGGMRVTQLRNSTRPPKSTVKRKQMPPRYRQQPWVRAREPLNHTSI